MNFPHPPANPAELAEASAQEPGSHGLDITLRDEHVLATLEYGAEQLGFIGQTYFVESARAFIMPATFDANNSVTYHNFYGLTFEGTFATYSKVHVGRLIGGDAIRAVCLAFPKATLLPFFDTLGHHDMLYVPVLAVSSMQAS